MQELSKFRAVPSSENRLIPSSVSNLPKQYAQEFPFLGFFSS